MRNPPGRLVDRSCEFHVLRARARDLVMGIGPEGYANINAPMRARKARPVNAPATSRPQPLNHADVPASSRKENTTSEASSNMPKRALSPPAVGGRDAKKARMSTWVDDGDESRDTSVANAELMANAITESPSKPEPSRAPLTPVATPAVKSKYLITNYELNGDEVVEVEPVTPALKRKALAAPESASTKQLVEIIELDDTEDEVSSSNRKRSAAKNAKASSKSVVVSKSRRPQDDATDDGTGEDETETSEYEEDPLAAAKKHAQAKKDLEKACRTCKTKANKSMKRVYELEISKLKTDNRKALSNVKAAATQQSRTEKDKFKKEIADLKAKHLEEITDLKEDHSDKKEELKRKRDKVLAEQDEKYKTMKEKLTESKTKLTKERDDANAKRIASENETRTKVRESEDEMRRGKLELAEKKKQLRREAREEVEQLKPEHSTLVKNKDKMIENLADSVAIYEARIKRAEHDLRMAETSASANHNRYEQAEAMADKCRDDVRKAEDNLREFEKYLTKFEGRHASEMARLEEQHDIVKGNLQEQTQRAVNLQRENLNAREALAVRARLCRESEAKVEQLTKQLREAQAEVGVAEHMNEMGW